MAEGFAAIGLVGNIIQFISFSFVLISKSRDLRQSTSGALDENVDLKVISEDIKIVISRINANSNSPTRLSDVAHRCVNIAQELLDAVAKLQHKQHMPGSGKTPTRWRTFQTALTCVWNSTRIEGLKTRLEQLRDQVIMHLVSDTSGNLRELMDFVEQWKRENRLENYDVTAQIQALDVQLQATQQRIADLHDEVFWKTLHEQFSQLSSKVHKVSQCHTIIASLRYDYMQIRQSAIRDAHERTFTWVHSDGTPITHHTRSSTGFTQWLQRDSGIYWITGKPGSGKSTLMKYLYGHDETIQNLRIWSGHDPLVRACFYFWSPGQQMQKSLEGLLQTLLYHILHACPELAPTICPERCEAISQSQQRDVPPPSTWTLQELKRSFALLRTRSSVATKFYFQIDGLDEYFGDSWDVIDTLRHLSKVPNVKLCLSSRPWNCFQDSFGRANPHVLRLHEFTRPDIELFARENLLLDGLDKDCQTNLFNDLVQDIGERAEGVFLWVRLVVRSLRNGISNKDPISLLQERLRAIPSDLEEFFEQILASVEDIYRSRMAATFIIAMRSPRPLKLIHYYFLDQENVGFSYDTPSKTWQSSVIQERAVQTEQQINGRYKGLLEAASTKDVSAQTTVDFLHRSLSDFLATKRMREKLQSWASDELNAFTAMSRAIIAESKFIDNESCPSTLKLAVELASKGAAETGNVAHCYGVIDQAELENERSRPSHSSCGLNCYIVRFAASLGHAEYLLYRMWRDRKALDVDRILKHAITCPVCPEETYRCCIPPAHTGQEIAAQLERRAGTIGESPLPSLVTLLFGLGADPNAIVDGTSSWTALTSNITELVLGDEEEQQQRWAVLNLFLGKEVDTVDLATAAKTWIQTLDPNAVSASWLQPALNYFDGLFGLGLDPTDAIQDSIPNKRNLLKVTQPSLPTCDWTDLPSERLRKFLRDGVDISMVYMDYTVSSNGTPRAWFQRVCWELVYGSALPLLSSRVSQYRVFLEHGLDPNVITYDGCTLWEGLLGAIRHGFQRGVYDVEYHRAVCDMLLVSLQYGADPEVFAIQRLLESRPLFLSQPFLSKDYLAHISRAVQREIKQREQQMQSQYRSQSRCGGA